jgi:hypothetical protein
MTEMGAEPAALWFPDSALPSRDLAGLHEKPQKPFPEIEFCV